MWYLHEQKLAKILRMLTNLQATTRIVLEIDILLLGLAYTVAHNAGEDFCFFTVIAPGDAQQEKSGGKRRGYEDLTKEGCDGPMLKKSKANVLE